MKTVTFDETQWKLVPVEPDWDMCAAGVFAQNIIGSVQCGAVYRAMLAAAPAAPTQPNFSLDHASIEGMDDTSAYAISHVVPGGIGESE